MILKRISSKQGSGLKHGTTLVPRATARKPGITKHQALSLFSALGVALCASVSRAGPDESLQVMRAQIELSVCDVPNAGTSDAVSATMDATGGSPTWLVGPGRDFQRGGRHRYDLDLEHVHRLSDIAGLVVSKPGNDDLCLRELRLIINEKPIFVRTFGAGGGLWLNASSSTLHTDRAELRANTAWQSYAWSLSEWIASGGGAILRGDLVQRLESCVGTAIHGLGFVWRSGSAAPIRLRRRNDTTVAATVDLARRVPFWFDKDVTLSFDLTLCNNGHAGPVVTSIALTPDDERMLTAIRDRLQHARPLVTAGDICPRVDQYANIT